MSLTRRKPNIAPSKMESGLHLFRAITTGIIRVMGYSLKREVAVQKLWQETHPA